VFVALLYHWGSGTTAPTALIGCQRGQRKLAKQSKQRTASWRTKDFGGQKPKTVAELGGCLVCWQPNPGVPQVFSRGGEGWGGRGENKRVLGVCAGAFRPVLHVRAVLLQPAARPFRAAIIYCARWHERPNLGSVRGCNTRV